MRDNKYILDYWMSLLFLFSKHISIFSVPGTILSALPGSTYLIPIATLWLIYYYHFISQMKKLKNKEIK